MDGIHDLGGRQGFGRIDTDEDEEQFHHPWEARMRGMVNAMGQPPDWSLDWFRHCRELIDPIDYLSRPYFDQWAQTYSAMLINSGLATVEELASGKAIDKVALAEGGKPPMPAAEVVKARPGAVRFDREVTEPPRFAVGDRVRTRALGTAGHTRLPAYARGRVGVIEDHHGAHLLADDRARGGNHAEALYTVGFDAAELWPDSEGGQDRVYLNLWQSYLEPA